MRVKALSLFDKKATTNDDFCKIPLGHFVDTVERDMTSYRCVLSQGLSVLGVDISQKILEVARLFRQLIYRF